MQITVLLFASAREIVGAPSIELELPQGQLVGDVKDELERQYPQLAALGPTLSWAVNERYSDVAAALGDGDRVAVLPPVSGG